MSRLESKYLGLTLKSPVIVSSSPLTATADHVERLEEHGTGAVVLKSVFEEQIGGESAFLERFNDYPEAADYLSRYVGDDYVRTHLDLIRETKSRVSIPVIASINCMRKGSWIEYAKKMQDAGADAIELNIYVLPSRADETSASIEARYYETVAAVAENISIPISVKLSSRFTNIINVVRELYFRGAKGVVMFNRYFEPDIDIKTMRLTSSDPLSSPKELRNSLRTVALCSALVPQMDISVSTGIHNEEDVVKAILAGAKTVQVCSALYENGLDFIHRANDFTLNWMIANGFGSIEDFCGRLNSQSGPDPQAYERAQFMKFFPDKVNL